MSYLRKLFGLKDGELTPKRQRPDHGPCCCCQTCGYDHDDCQCKLNSEIEAVLYAEKLEAENERLLGKWEDAVLRETTLMAENERLRDCLLILQDVVCEEHYDMIELVLKGGNP